MSENTIKAGAVAIAGASGGNSFAAAGAVSGHGGSATAVAVAGNGFAAASASTSTASSVGVTCRTFNQVPCRSAAQGVTLGCQSASSSSCRNSALFMVRNPQVMRTNMTLIVIQSGCQQAAGSQGCGSGSASTFSGSALNSLLGLLAALTGNQSASSGSCGSCGDSSGAARKSDVPAGVVSDLMSQFSNLPQALLDKAKSFANSSAGSAKDGKQSAQYKELFQKAFLLYLFLHMAQSFLGGGKQDSEKTGI